MALFVLSPFLAPAEIEVWLALSKVFKFAYCDRVNPESMGYYETIVQNFVATTVVHGIFLLYGGSPKSTCFFIFLKICECLVRHLVITLKGEQIRFAFAGSSYSPSERCGDDLIALYHSMGVQRYLGGTSVQHDKPIHQPELGSIVLNALDLGNTTSLYDLKDFTLLLPPGITLSTIGHFAKAIVGADGKVINLCDHVVYTVEKRYSLETGTFCGSFQAEIGTFCVIRDMEPIVDAQQKPVFNNFDCPLLLRTNMHNSSCSCSMSEACSFCCL
eukprot:Em0008g1152a